MLLTTIKHQTTRAVINQQATAGVFIAITNLATTQLNVAASTKFHAKEDAAVMCLNIMKFNVADMFHSTTVKHAAAKFQNTIALMNAKHVTKLFAINIANTFQDTIGNTFAKTIKQLLAATIANTTIIS